MKYKALNPEGAHPPFSDYSLAAEVTDAKRWLHISGQVGVHLDGSLAEGAEAQMTAAFDAIDKILAGAEMSKTNLVKLTVFLTRTEDVALYRAARDRFMDGHLCASTLLVISALAHPDWLVEIEAVAAA